MIYQDKIKIARPSFLGGQEWSVNGLNEITILFGKNGSGKSQFLRSWRDSDVGNSHYVIPERIGTLQYESRYFDQQLTPETRRNTSTSNFSESYRQQVISRIQTYFTTRGAVRGTVLKGTPGELEDLFKFLLPDFAVTLTNERPLYRLERLSNQDVVSDINVLSSGEAQMFTVALDLLTMAAIWEVEERERRVILIDEPDAHLHPDLQVRFADFLLRVMEKFHLQIVISTHSTTLLSAVGQFGKEKCSIVYMTKTIAEYRAQPFTENLKEISACLGGHVLMGPLFGSPILLVEGDDDYRIWSQVPRHGNVNFAVLPSNGDEIKAYQKLIEKIFASIAEPKILGHALLDGDKSLPIPTVHNTQTYIPYIKLTCHESENLFISDEVLAELGHTWETAQALLNENASKFGNKDSALRNLANSDRKTVDFKNIINEVSKILDPKNVHWTTRVGNKIGKNKPEGQLADFLGVSVINALWGEN